MNHFFNRPEGHEIVEIGRANVQGFHNNFYILAPGVLDQLHGKVSLDGDIIDLINKCNSGVLNSEDRDCNKCTQNKSCTDDSEDYYCDDDGVVVKSIGHIINATLQNVISFEVTTLEGDHRVLGTAIHYTRRHKKEWTW